MVSIVYEYKRNNNQHLYACVTMTFISYFDHSLYTAVIYIEYYYYRVWIVTATAAAAW